MNVGDLIQELQKYDKAMLVMVDGYEGGFNDVIKECITIKDIALNIHDIEGIYGPHENAFCPYWIKSFSPETKKVKALILQRYEEE